MVYKGYLGAMYISIFIPLTRPNRIEAMAKNVAELQIPSNAAIIQTLVVIDDSRIKGSVVEDIFNKVGCYGTRVVSTEKPGASPFNMQVRRGRIAATFEFAKRFLHRDADLVFTIEDDTDIDSDALQLLLETYLKIRNPGLISGVQVGRWAFNILGAWRADDPANPTTIESVQYGKGVQPVDATGFYCFIVSKELFNVIKHKWGDFGPDVYYGLALRSMGCNNYINWNVIARHVTDDGILIPKPDLKVAKYILQGTRFVLTDYA